jgi:hypothetical protein
MGLSRSWAVRVQKLRSSSWDTSSASVRLPLGEAVDVVQDRVVLGKVGNAPVACLRRRLAPSSGDDGIAWIHHPDGSRPLSVGVTRPRARPGRAALTVGGAGGCSTGGRPRR